MDQISNALDIARDYVNLRILYGSLPEYIVTKGETNLRGNLIGEEWENIYSKVTLFQGTLTTVVEGYKKRGFVNPGLEDLVHGNLCTFVNSDEFNSQQCASFNGGILLKGILGMNGALLRSLRNVKDYYDYSSKSTADMINAFDMEDYINIETLDFNWVKPSYSELINILQYQAKKSLELDKDDARSIVIGYFFIYAFALFFLRLKLFSLMENERRNWRCMLRSVPNRILLDNKHLKTYLLTHCDGQLESIKKYLV